MDQGSELEAQDIRIVLADDHHVVRRALRTYIERQQGCTVVGEVADGRSLLENIESLQPDVLLMDLRMPHHKPVEVTAELKAVCPSLKILVLSAYKIEQQILALLLAGVDGYIYKGDPADTLVKAIRHVMADHTYVSPYMASILAGEVGEGEGVTAEPPELTARQKEVLVLIARGYSNEEIAAELGIAENTVRNHASRLYRSLGVSTRVEAVVYGLARELIHLHEIM